MRLLFVSTLAAFGAIGCFRDLDFAPCQENPSDPICTADSAAETTEEASSAETGSTDDAADDTEPVDAPSDAEVDSEADSATDSTVADSTIADSAMADSTLDTSTTTDSGADTKDTGVDAATDTKADAAADTKADADSCVVNACGGCNVLSPAKGAVCGTCSTSSYACATTTTTVCTKPDDRADGTDTYFSSTAKDVWPIATGQTVGQAFTLRRAGSVTKLTLGIKTAVADGAAAVGNLHIRLINGYPTLSPVAADVLSTVDIPANTLPTSAPFTITLPTPTATLANGSHLWIEITDQSARYDITILGNTRSAPSDHSFWFIDMTTPPGTWIEYPIDFAYLAVGLHACF